MLSGHRTLGMDSRLRGNDGLSGGGLHSEADRFASCHHFHAAHFDSDFLVYASAPGIVADSL